MAKGPKPEDEAYLDARGLLSAATTPRLEAREPPDGPLRLLEVGRHLRSGKDARGPGARQCYDFTVAKCWRGRRRAKFELKATSKFRKLKRGARSSGFPPSHSRLNWQRHPARPGRFTFTGHGKTKNITVMAQLRASGTDTPFLAELRARRRFRDVQLPGEVGPLRAVLRRQEGPKGEALGTGPFLDARSRTSRAGRLTSCGGSAFARRRPSSPRGSGPRCCSGASSKPPSRPSCLAERFH